VNEKSFFEEPLEQSRFKSEITSKYFWAWAQVIMGAQDKNKRGTIGKIAYIDLFAGPGRYADGSKSTPLLVLEKAISDQKIRNRLVTYFNDINPEHATSLEEEIRKIEGYSKLKYKPTISNKIVGDEIAAEFEQYKLVPTLLFIDPWGYKGLSIRLVNSVLKDWGCDCIFFFNYNRINMGLNNPCVIEHMNALFGEERANSLRIQLIPLLPHERELIIVEELSRALKEARGEYVLPFRFRNERGTRTTHHLIFISKNFKGYEIMKGIMAKESSSSNNGIASFEYNPASEKYPTLFPLTRTLDDLESILINEFAGQALTMREIYEQHNVGTPFTASNYKEVLKRLESKGLISADPPANNRPKDSFANRVRVRFQEVKS